MASSEDLVTTGGPTRPWSPTPGGYRLVELPRAAPEERLRFVLDRLGVSRSSSR